MDKEWAFGRLGLAPTTDYQDNESIQYVLDKTQTLKNEMDPPWIFQALETNNREIIRAVVAEGVSIEKENERGFSVLQIALARGKFSLLQTLIELGADPYAANQWDSPITWCEKTGQTAWAEKMEAWYQARIETRPQVND
ncbi:MAG: hypothetical protein H6510_17720 [Acidobacteria bacterium]|nr:hypothetical protein [Acidobacteriota bacterium]